MFIKLNLLFQPFYFIINQPYLKYSMNQIDKLWIKAELLWSWKVYSKRFCNMITSWKISRVDRFQGYNNWNVESDIQENTTDILGKRQCMVWKNRTTCKSCEEKINKFDLYPKYNTGSGWNEDYFIGEVIWKSLYQKQINQRWL